MALRRAVVGGNWKCNGTKAQVQQLIGMLNGVKDIPATTEVIHYFECLSAVKFIRRL